MEDKHYNITLIDEFSLYAESLAESLKSRTQSFTVSRCATIQACLSQLSERSAPDLYLASYYQSGVSGVGILHALRTRGVTQPLILIAGAEDVSEDKLISSGVSAHVPRTASIEDLVTAIDRALKQGSTPTAPTSDTRADSQPAVRLTARQLEVLDLIARGHTNRAIGDQLGLTEHTIKAHVSAMFREMGVSNRTACINLAMRLGLIALPERP